ncbi:MAG: glycosyltransferase [Candidatus Nanopelagicales bacterium]
MKVSLVVSTIGRPVQMHRLLESLRPIEDPGVELIVVDQTDDGASALAAERFGLPFPVLTTRSARGLSHGRNVGLALATGDVVTFPDDDCFYRPDTVGTARRLLGDTTLAGVSGAQLTLDGRPSMLRWPDTARDITRANFYRTAISSTMFLRRSVVTEVGGFDETLGAGSKEGYGSGEESDLVLRVLEAGHRLRYDPALVVLQDEPRDDLPADFAVKMSGYGRGFGRLFRQHHLSRGLFETLLARKRVGALVRRVRGNAELAEADRAFIRGAREGFRSWR